ncbi:hypothetical protein H4218_005674, partial [Coemansia sp. IMI 209128]
MITVRARLLNGNVATLDYDITGGSVSFAEIFESKMGPFSKSISNYFEIFYQVNVGSKWVKIVPKMYDNMAQDDSIMFLQEKTNLKDRTQEMVDFYEELEKKADEDMTDEAKLSVLE